VEGISPPYFKRERLAITRACNEKETCKGKGKGGGYQPLSNRQKNLIISRKGIKILRASPQETKKGNKLRKSDNIDVPAGRKKEKVAKVWVSGAKKGGRKGGPINIPLKESAPWKKKKRKKRRR